MKRWLPRKKKPASNGVECDAHENAREDDVRGNVNARAFDVAECERATTTTMTTTTTIGGDVQDVNDVDRGSSNANDDRCDVDESEGDGKDANKTKANDGANDEGANETSHRGMIEELRERIVDLERLESARRTEAEDAKDARRREAFAGERTLEELERVSGVNAILESERARLVDARETSESRASEAEKENETLRRTLFGMCDALTRFAERCGGLGLVDARIATRAEGDAGFWIEIGDDELCERPRALLRAVTDAHEASCAEYERKISEAQKTALDEFGEALQLEMREEVERAIGHFELERVASGESPSASGGGLRLYRTPDVLNSKSKTSRTRERELEAERREAHDRFVAYEQEIHTLRETFKAIERELREELDATTAEADGLRAERKLILEERNLVINKLEIELQRLESDIQASDEAKTRLTFEATDNMRRAQEDLDQERRRHSLALQSKEAEIAELTKRVQEAMTRIEDLTEDQKRLNDVLAQQRKLKQKLEEHVAGSEARIEGLLQEIDAMDAASAQASTHVSNAMASAAESHHRAISDMRSKFAEAEAYIEALESREAVMEDERSVLKRELDKARAREKELRNRLSDAEARSNELTGEINALLEQEARRSALRESDFMAHISHRAPASPSDANHTVSRQNVGAHSSAKKLEVREISDGDSDGEEFVVVRTRGRTAPNTPFMVANSPLNAHQLRGPQSAQSGAINSALALARAELAEARAKRDRNVRKIEI